MVCDRPAALQPEHFGTVVIQSRRTGSAVWKGTGFFARLFLAFVRAVRRFLLGCRLSVVLAVSSRDFRWSTGTGGVFLSSILRRDDRTILRNRVGYPLFSLRFANPKIIGERRQLISIDRATGSYVRGISSHPESRIYENSRGLVRFAIQNSSRT